jgi:FHA domain
MSILIIEQDGRRQAGALSGRVLIGRMEINTVVVEDRSVSRIHAWIGKQDDNYYVADSGSRTGTFLNGRPVRNRQVLSDGDEIYIGPLRLTYHSDAQPPPDAEAIDLAPRSEEELSVGKGVFMECTCGAPLWMPRTFLGQGQCRYCGNKVERRQSAAAPAQGRRSQAAEPAKVEVPEARPEPEIVPLSVDQDFNFDDLLEESLPSATVPDSAEEPQEQAAAVAPADHASVEQALIALASEDDAPIALASDDDAPIAAASEEDAPIALATEDNTAPINGLEDDAPIPIEDESLPFVLPPEPVARPAEPVVARPEQVEVSPEPLEAPPEPVVIPLEPATTAAATTQKKTTEKRAPKADPQCGVCHTPISMFEETVHCPSCRLPFHSDCWAENRGCSAYGCPQVGALEEKAPS